jgi:REP element-mobilizing transposase RayT
MNRGRSRQKVFLEKNDFEGFLKALAEAHELWGVEIFAYCLMGSHYHLCLRTPEGNLSRVMRHIDGLYTQRFNRTHRRDGPLFRGRYKAIVVDADTYLTSVVRYIHLNPAEAKITQSPDDYRWSSHRAYLDAKRAPKWLAVKEVLGYFKSGQEYHRFIFAGNEEKIKDFYGRKHTRPVLGEEGFIERIKQQVVEMDREHPRYERAVLRPVIQRVQEAVARAYNVNLDEVVKGHRGRRSEARKVGMYLVKRLCDITLQQTADNFGVGSYGVVGWACHGVREKLKLDGGFRRRVEGIEREIKYNQQKI